MSSSRSVPPGVSPDLIQPAFRWTPPRGDSLGDLAVELVGLFGIACDPEQRLALDTLLSTRADVDLGERFAQLESCVVEPRQNGKTGGILLPIALLAAIRRPDQLVVWSAHRYKTSHEAFLSVLKLYRSSPALAARISKVSFSNGEEAFEFHNGSRIIFVARSQASGRGLSGDVVILDEALFLTGEMMGALLPTLSARPDPLVIYASSAGLASSRVLVDIRDRGRAGDDPSLAYIEWCAPQGGCADRDCDHAKTRVGCAADDPANWRAANPAMGAGRITEDYVRAERRALPVREFLRERMGWWEERGSGGLFHMPSWWRAQSKSTTAGPRIAMALHFTPDRSAAAVAVASRRRDGRIHVEVIAHEAGVAWAMPYVLDRAKRHKASAVALAGGMAAGHLAADLERVRGFKALGTSDVRRACARFFDLVHAGTPQLAVRPHPDLNDAVDAARRSSQTTEWVFTADTDEETEPADLSPLYAAALAVWMVGGNRSGRTDAELLGTAY